jgi:uncharacterized protein
MGILFDVNILMALGWDTHVFHQRVLEWFKNHPSDDWWTCALTESAFIRLSSNPKVINVPPSPTEARVKLAQMLQHPLHHFAADTPSPQHRVFDDHLTLATKAEHVSDAYLIGLARHHGLRFLTADAGLVRLAGSYPHIELLP